MKKTNNSIGFVYVLSNPTLPGLVKVGLTTRLPEDRSLELFNTSVPTPFEVVFRIATSRPCDVEKLAHDLLIEHRVNPKREFFKVSIDDAIAAVRYAAIEAAGIDSWESGVVHNLCANDRVALSLEAGQVFALISYPDMFSNNAEIIDIWQVHSSGDQLELYAVNSASNVYSFSNYHPYSEEDPVPYLDREGKVVNGMMNGREMLVSGERLIWIPSMHDTNDQKSAIFEADHPVQIVSRTWSPKLGPHGLPLLMNDFLYKSVWPEAKRAINEGLSLPFPRTWAPRENRGVELEEFGTSPQSPDFGYPVKTKVGKKVKLVQKT